MEDYGIAHGRADAVGGPSQGRICDPTIGRADPDLRDALRQA